MTKTEPKMEAEKTNGHPVTEIKTAPPKVRATRAAAAKKPADSAGTSSAPVAKPAAKTAAAKPPAKVPAKPAAAKPAAVKPAAVKAAVKPVAVKAAAKPAAAKPAVKSAAKAAPKPAAKPSAKAVDAAPADAAKEKVRKPKLVRDSFTMPEQEYAVLGQVKKACLKAGFEIKKSELLRIGVALISQLDLATLQKVLSSLPQLKTGRPKSE